MTSPQGPAREERWQDWNGKPSCRDADGYQHYATADYLNALEMERDELRKQVNDNLELVDYREELRLMAWKTNIEAERDAYRQALEDSLQSWGCTCSEEGFKINDPQTEWCRWHKALALSSAGRETMT